MLNQKLSQRRQQAQRRHPQVNQRRHPQPRSRRLQLPNQKKAAKKASGKPKKAASGKPKKAASAKPKKAKAIGKKTSGKKAGGKKASGKKGRMDQDKDKPFWETWWKKVQNKSLEKAEEEMDGRSIILGGIGLFGTGFACGLILTKRYDRGGAFKGEPVRLAGKALLYATLLNVGVFFGVTRLMGFKSLGDFSHKMETFVPEKANYFEKVCQKGFGMVGISPGNQENKGDK